MKSEERTVAGELARDILIKFPDSPSLQLAKILHAKHPLVFASVQNARQRVSYYRGTAGARNRKQVKASIVKESLRTKEESDKVRAKANCSLPESDAKEWLPFFIDDQVKRVGILADVHLPYHDKKALEGAIEAMRKRKPDLILLNGDITDCHVCSRFEKDPRARNFTSEIQLTGQFFDYLQNRLPKVGIIWKLGNHEERYFHYLCRNAPALVGLPMFDPESVFGLAARGARIIGDKRIIRCGKLPIIHGHEYPSGFIGPVNAARGYFLRAKSSVLGSHSHQKSEHFEPNIKGENLGAWCTGCLCDLHPEYARLNKWSHGWALVEKDSSGDYEVSNLKV